MSGAATWGVTVAGAEARGASARSATTPARLRTLALLAAVGAGLMWLAGGLAVAGTRAEVVSIGQRTVPVAIGARKIHAELADADRAAASDFLLGASETSEPRQEYELDLSTANAQLEQAAELNGPGGVQSEDLQKVISMVTEYAGLIEAARANDRQGLPLGAAYLRTASTLMHQPNTGILARVDALDGYQPSDPAGDGIAKMLLGGALATFYLAAIGLFVLLISTQVFLRRRFRRRRSNPLLAATVVLVALVVAMSVQAVSTYRSLSTMEDDVFPRLHTLWLMRSLAADANADESLSVATKGTGSDFQSQFDAATHQLVDRPLTPQLADAAVNGDVRFNGLLADDIRSQDEPAERTAALRVLRGYEELLQVDAAIRARTAAGDYDGAAALLVGSSQLGTASADLNTALQQGIDAEQAQLDDLVVEAQPSPLVDIGLGGASVLVVLLVLWGVLPRIAEYRV